MQKNPYIIGRPITDTELLFGRQKIFDFIYDNLNQRVKVILLHGQRRIGKSSVLSLIPKFPRFVQENDFAFVLFDLQDKAELPLSSLLYSLATEIIEYLKLPSDSITLPSTKELETDPNIFSNHFLPTVYQALGGKNIVLLLDEFDVLSSDDRNSAVQHFFPYLKSLLKQQQKLFIIPVVGRELDDMQKLLGLFKGAPNKEIGLLDEPSAMELITNPAKNILEYEPDAILAILELSAGHPFFTQIICFAIFMRAREEQRQQVTRTDVENIIDQAIEYGEAGLVWFREALPIPERVVFSAAAELQEITVLGSESALKEPLKLLEENGVIETEKLSQATKQLVKWNFLQKVNSSKLSTVRVPTYKVTIELVRRWLVRQYSLTEVIYQLENFDPEAHRLYTEATEVHQQGKVANAIKLYEQVLETNPNHFKALFQLAEAYSDVREFSKAIESYERAYKVDPVSDKYELVRSRLNYGEHLMTQKQFHLAQQQFNKVLALQPKNPLAKQQLKKVEEEIRRALTGPFFVGNFVPQEQFLGRKEESSIAFAQILNSSNWFFYGSPGIGKTSFLKYLAAPNTWQARRMNSDDEYLLVYLNCESIHDFTPSAFWKQVLIELKEVLNHLQEKYQIDSPVQSNIEKIESLQTEIDAMLHLADLEKDHVKQILKHIKQRDKFLVLLLDNYNAIIEQKNNDNEAEMLKFLREFRNLAEHEADRRLATIMTSSKPLSDLSSPSTYNDLPYTSRPLKPFQDTEVLTLWNQMPETFKHRQEILTKVKLFTGGYPALFQMFCFLLYNSLMQQQTPVVETLESDFEVNAEVIIRSIWQSFNDIERMLLRLIALYYVGGKIEKRRYDLSGIEDCLKEQAGKLNDLEKRGIILGVVKQNKKVYAFTASAMQQWVIREILSNSPAEIDDRERVFGIMNQGHVKKIQNAIEWVGKNSESVMPIAGGITEIFMGLL